MQVGNNPAPRHATAIGKDREPIIQFPEEEENQPVVNDRNQVNILMNKHILGSMMQAMSQGSGSKSGSFGPRSSDMIPPMRGLSNLQVSFGSDGDVVMTSAERVLGKRAAEDEEVQGGGLTSPLDWTMVVTGSGKGVRRRGEMNTRTQTNLRLVSKDRDRGWYALGM
jgi:hypothetical protein